MRRWAVLGVAAGAGYLAGSVSFSRLLGRWRAPGTDLTRTEVLVPQTGETVTLGGTTPTSVAQHLGGRWAVVAVVLEAAKAAAPALAARRLWPGTAAAEVAAAAAVLGHAYPLWQKGRDGGYGESPMLGGMLVLDPLGFLVTNGALAAVMGLTRDGRLVMAYPLTLPVWAAARRDRDLLGFSLAVNAVMWSRVVPEWRSSLSGVVSRG
jgi:glycerol-3-phosphate acyltransferase PlsY